MFTLEEAKDILRIDGNDNDSVIFPLTQAVTPYIALTTGYKAPDNQEPSPLAKTTGQFLLRLWYFGDDVDKIQRAVDSLSKALAAEQGKEI